MTQPDGSSDGYHPGDVLATDGCLKEGRGKVEIGLARGKKVHDNRSSLREREAAREMDRAARGSRTASFPCRADSAPTFRPTTRSSFSGWRSCPPTRCQRR